MANFYGADSMTQCFGTKDSEGVIIVEVITWERVPVRDYVDGGTAVPEPLSAERHLHRQTAAFVAGRDPHGDARVGQQAAAQRAAASTKGEYSPMFASNHSRMGPYGTLFVYIRVCEEKVFPADLAFI